MVSRHKCLIYEGHPSEQLPVITPLLTQSLQEGHRCLYLGDPSMIDLVKAAMAKTGVDVGQHARRGALVFSAQRDHLEGGRFDPKAMVEGLRTTVDESINDGFKGLFATGDMRWELGQDSNFDALLEYEARLDQAFVDLPLQGVCQYHLDTIPSRAVRDALLTHRSTYIGQLLNEDNLFYLPPEMLIDNPIAVVRDKQGEWMWRQLKRILQAERERDGALAELERRVEQRTAELKASNRELELFAYAVSHDLKAPLRSIEGFCGIILKKHSAQLNSEARDLFGYVQQSVERLTGLINALLEMSRVVRCEVKRQLVDLSHHARIALAQLRAETGRVVAVTVEPGLTVEGDERLIPAALANLLGNAWKFTARSASPSIEFGREKGSGGGAFFIKDNGAGFDMAHAHRLFEPFQRLHARGEFPGHGIGLAMAKRIIERHGGRIWARGHPERGAIFYFTLP